MEYKKESSIICLGDTKQAALYFDRIFPLSFMFNELFRLPEFKSYFKDIVAKYDTIEDYRKSNPENKKILGEIISKHSSSIKMAVFGDLLGKDIDKFHDEESFRNIMESLFKYFSFALLSMRVYKNKNRLNEFPKSAIKQFNDIFELEKLDYSKGLKLLEYAFNLLCIFYTENIQISNLSTEDPWVFNLSEEIRESFDVASKLWSGRCGQILLPSFSVTNREATENDVSLTLSNIKLIDTSKVEWEQIIEYRKDIEAQKKIRNLKLFLHTNYQGKNLSYIEDDLGKRLDGYYNTCKDWGFETLSSTISVVMDSENLISLIAGSSGATLFGGPVAGLAVGGGILLANISLNIAKRKYAFNKFKRDHELAYIIEAKERLENVSKS